MLRTISNTLGAGLFVPVEQELSRRAAAANVAGEGTVGIALRSGQVAAALLVAINLGCLTMARPIASGVFDGQVVLVGCLALTTAAFAAQHLTRGVLSAAGRFDAYGLQMLADGVLRNLGVLGVVAWIALAGPERPAPAIGALGAVVVLAPALSLAVSARR
ncbi:MAG: hypothetical protein ACR2FG_12510 [Marmoricola sp.]